MNCGHQTRTRVARRSFILPPFPRLASFPASPKSNRDVARDLGRSLKAGAIGAAQGAMLGALGGAVGGAVLSRVGASFLGTTLSGAAGGAASGFVGGGVQGYLNGQGFWKGAAQGVLYGGIIGGATGAAGCGLGRGTAYLGKTIRGNRYFNWGGIKGLPAQPAGLPDARSSPYGRLLVRTDSLRGNYGNGRSNTWSPATGITSSKGFSSGSSPLGPSSRPDGGASDEWWLASVSHGHTTQTTNRRAVDNECGRGRKRTRPRESGRCCFQSFRNFRQPFACG